MPITTTAVTIAEDVKLDLGHTDLIGNLVFDDQGLVLIAPSGTTQLLGHRKYTATPGEVFEAPAGRILIEEMGLYRALPAALDSTGHFLQTARHSNLSPWGADVVELLVIVPVVAGVTVHE